MACDLHHVASFPFFHRKLRTIARGTLHIYWINVRRRASVIIFPCSEGTENELYVIYCVGCFMAETSSTIIDN